MKSILIILTLIISLEFYAQENKISIYNPDADAKKEIEEAIIKAKTENKHVFIQIGGNWCPWCIKFHNFVSEDKELDSLLNANYIVVKMNYDKEHKNEELLKRFEYPQRFGFPVFVILDSEGRRIHTQNSGLLEKDKSYDKDNVKMFFKHWTLTAIDPNSYK